MNNILKDALMKGELKKRLNKNEALALLNIEKPSELHALGKSALMNRSMRFGDRASYVENLFINPSNVCHGKCLFCHYRADKGEKSAYSLNEDFILNQINKMEPVEVHIVGGLNNDWTFRRTLDLIKNIREKWPDIYIKSFTAVEIDYFAKEEGKSSEEILEILKSVPIQGLTGGGAEIFSLRLRKKYCPEKLSPDGWIDIHKKAHAFGLKSNATLLYGLDETNEEIVDHLFALRETQDLSKGFSCFIPLAYQPSENDEIATGPSTFDNLKMVAVARLILDNFDHIKAYWPMIGLETASVALSFGADDLDGTLGDEKIAHAGINKNPRMLTRDRIEETIKLGGFKPFSRDGYFNER